MEKPDVHEEMMARLRQSFLDDVVCHTAEHHDCDCEAKADSFMDSAEEILEDHVRRVREHEQKISG